MLHSLKNILQSYSNKIGIILAQSKHMDKQHRAEDSDISHCNYSHQMRTMILKIIYLLKNRLFSSEKMEYPNTEE